MGYTKSKYQIDISNVYKETDSNILINSVAGSGKTTTLLDLLQDTYKPSIFLAFNSSIAKEIAKKTKGHPMVKVMTLHSLGMKSLIKHFGYLPEVKKSKIWTIAAVFSKQWAIPKKKEWIKTVFRLEKLLDMYRLTLCEGKDDMRRVADEMGLEYKKGDMNKLMQLVDAYEKYNKRPEIIDFTDMIYLPATNDEIDLIHNPKVVFVDECQDLNKCQHALVDKIIEKNNARFVACGDPYQSIYGFAGAHSRSFDLFKQKDNVKEMPLSICYRCPQDVICESNKVYPIMEGFKETLGSVRDGYVDEIEEGDMVLCRNVKPLVQTYFSLINDGKKAFIKGKDLGKGLIDLIKPYRYSTIAQLRINMQQISISKMTELKEMGITKPTSHPSYVNLEEKIDTIQIVAGRFQRTEELITFLEKIFADDDREGVVLSTIHKAKGLECKRVFLLDTNLIPSKFANTPEQLQQEKNLLYVAMTRATEELVYLGEQREKYRYLENVGSLMEV